MRQAYQVVDRRDSRTLSEFLSKDGQLLLPLLELIEKAELAVDELIDVVIKCAARGGGAGQRAHPALRA